MRILLLLIFLSINFNLYSQCTNPPSVADVGADFSICLGSGTFNLNATQPTVGTGTWTSNSTGSGWIENPNLGTTSVDMTLDGTPGVKEFIWTVSEPGCPSSSATVQVTYDSDPTSIANAGSDINFCGTSTQLNADVPTDGIGTWSVVSGTALFDKANSPTSLVSGLSAGTNTVRWTISKGSCIGTFSDINIIASPVLTGISITNNSSCNGISNGQIIINAQAGYTYNINTGLNYTGAIPANNFTMSSNLEVISSLSSDDYTIRIEDPKNGCFVEKNITITNVAGPTNMNVTADKTVLCDGDNQSVIISLDNSELNVDYELFRNGLSTTQILNGTGSALNYLSESLAGVYSVKAKPTSMPVCVIEMNNNPIINNINKPIINSITTNCLNSKGTGTISINANVNSGILEYSINGKDWQLSKNFSSVANATYEVFVREQSSMCSDTSTLSVFCNLPPVIVTSSISILNNSSTQGSLFSNISDPDGDIIKFNEQKNITTKNGGLISIDSVGIYSYTSPLSFIGNDTVYYQVCDSVLIPSCTTSYIIFSIKSITNTLDQFNLENINIYPNPSSDFINIDSDNEKTIIDSFGNIIIQTTDTKINIQNLNNGIYFLHINNKSLKFIKN